MALGTAEAKDQITRPGAQRRGDNRATDHGFTPKGVCVADGNPRQATAGDSRPLVLNCLQHLAYAARHVKERAVGGLRFGGEKQKRLYISAGFDDYPLATGG